MVFGARQFGTRTFGDGTSYASYVPVVSTLDATMSGSIDIIATGNSASAIPTLYGTAAGTISITGASTSSTVLDAWPDSASIVLRGHAVIPFEGTRRTTTAVDLNGVPLPNGSLADCVHGPITWRLNEPTEWSVSLKTDNPKANIFIDEAFQEFQLKRGNQLLVWGPSNTPTLDNDDMSVNGYGPLWYFSRLHVGRARRRNYLTSPSFEQGLAGWTIRYGHPHEGATGRNPAYVLGTLSTERSVTGRYSGRLELPDDTYPQFGGVFQQDILWEVDAASQDGDEWSVGVQVFIPSATLRSREGAQLKFARFSTTEFIDVYDVDGVFQGSFPKPIEELFVPITEDFPVNKWTRMSSRLFVPLTGQFEFIQISVWGVRGVIFIDDAQLSYNERLEWFSTDQMTIATDLINHGQDTAYDKVDLNIGVSAPPSGIKRDLTVLFSEHVEIYQILRSLTLLDDGFDMRETYSSTGKVIQFESPGGGQYRPSCALKLRAEIQRFKYTFDGQLAASSVVTLGEGFGGEREEGFAEDPSAFANGIVIEEVFPAEAGTPAASLDNIATERLVIGSAPAVLEFDTGPNPALVTKLLSSIRVGDVVPVDLFRGPLAIASEKYRLVEWTLELDDRLHGTLNRRNELTP